MCGRVVTTWSASRLAEYFSAAVDPDLACDFDPDDVDVARYNVAPTSPLTVVRLDHEGHRVVDRCHWGLVPRWAKDTSGASKMINARAESLFERPSYRPLLVRHRCVVPVDGFYEWGPDRRPRYVHDLDDLPLEIAGLWTTWIGPDGHALRSCTLLTTESAGSLADVHHRMPVALDPSDREVWLTREPLHPDEVASIVEDARRRALGHWRWHEVSRDVNKVGTDRRALIDPLPTEPTQGQLFGG